MIKTTNTRFLRALSKQPVDATPIWIMRQAGRYLPEYREVRAKIKDFLTLCKTPELACEVTLQPLRRFPLDAAIIFSDILTIPDAMGLGLYFETNEGPRFKNPITDVKSITNLPIPEIESELKYVMDAIRLVTRELNGQIPLIGFSGSPWTLATYMIEGGGSKHFYLIKKFLFTQPEILTVLLTKLVTAITLYLQAQIEAGVQAVMLFDTWGGILSRADYLSFSLNPMTQIIKALKKSYPHVPIILFTKNSSQWLEVMADSGADALGIDWTIDIGEARTRIGHKVALQGNLDPATLYATPHRIREEVRRIITNYGDHPGHVFNLGHGIHPNIDPDHVAILVEAVHDMSATMHQSKPIDINN